MGASKSVRGGEASIPYVNQEDFRASWESRHISRVFTLLPGDFFHRRA